MSYRNIIAILFLIFVIGCKDSMVDESNIAPKIEVIGFKSDPLIFVKNQDYLFEFKVIDEDGDDIEVIVESFDGIIKDLLYSGDNLFSAYYQPDKKGEHRLKIVATDKIETSTKLLYDTFFANTPPTAMINYKQLINDPVKKEFTYLFGADSSKDPDGDLVNYIWTFRQGSSVAVKIEGKSMVKVDRLFTGYGIYRVTLEVTDNDGGIGRDSALIDNSLPVSVSPIANFVFQVNNDTSYAVKNQVDFSLDASGSKDGDGSKLTNFFWYLKKNNKQIFLSESTSPITSMKLFHDPGIHQLGLKVVNGNKATSPITWHEIKIIDSKPFAEFTADINYRFKKAFYYDRKTGKLLTNRATSYDITIRENKSTDQDPGKLKYKWFIEGELIKLRNISEKETFKTNISIPTDLKNKTTHLLLVVTDEQGLEAEARVIARNTSPK